MDYSKIIKTLEAYKTEMKAKVSGERKWAWHQPFSVFRFRTTKIVRHLVVSKKEQFYYVPDVEIKLDLEDVNYFINKYKCKAKEQEVEYNRKKCEMHKRNLKEKKDLLAEVILELEESEKNICDE